MGLEFKDTIHIQPTEESGGGGGGTPSVGIPRELTAQGVLQMPLSVTSYKLPEGVTDVGDYALCYAFYRCANLASVDFTGLTDLSGDHAMYMAFTRTGVTTLNFPDLKTITGSMALAYAFDGSAVTSVYFPALTSIGNDNINQFASMLLEIDHNCTVHFPSNMESVLSPFINTTVGKRLGDPAKITVLYDLSATA